VLLRFIRWNEIPDQDAIEDAAYGHLIGATGRGFHLLGQDEKRVCGRVRREGDLIQKTVLVLRSLQRRVDGHSSRSPHLNSGVTTLETGFRGIAQDGEPNPTVLPRRRLNGDQNRLKSRLKQVLGGALTQDFVPDAAKDYFYELEMAAHWKDCGFTVELAEPDVVVSGNGLSAPLGVACKYPSGLASLHDHISKGYGQITKHGYEGLVAIGLDQLVCKGMSNYMDFRQTDKHPLDIMERLTSE
jgi:hypothetical protein